MQNGNPLGVLQEQLALHAPDLIQHNFMDLKTVIATLQSLEGTKAPGESEEGNEERLQQFLRGGAPQQTPEVEGTIQ